MYSLRIYIIILIFICFFLVRYIIKKNVNSINQSTDVKTKQLEQIQLLQASVMTQFETIDTCTLNNNHQSSNVIHNLHCHSHITPECDLHVEVIGVSHTNRDINKLQQHIASHITYNNDTSVLTRKNTRIHTHSPVWHDSVYNASSHNVRGFLQI